MSAGPVLNRYSDLPECEQELNEIDVVGFLDSTRDLNSPVRRFDSSNHEQGSYATIQAAIDAARDGDCLRIGPGTYREDLYIDKPVTLCGPNAGQIGQSTLRAVEAALAGHIVVGCCAKDVTIDGFSIAGSVGTELAAQARQSLALRNSVINGSGSRAALQLFAGAGVTIANNVIVGGADEAIYVPYGFNDLAITGNRICAAEGAVGIALHGGAGVDRINVFGNVLVGGDYGVLIEVDSGLEQAGDAITIAGNQFGEAPGGTATGAPVVAAIRADRPVPVALHRSLGTSLELNTYNMSAAAVRADVVFDLRKTRSVRRSPAGTRR
jgi:hypothetical protein